MNVVLSLVMLAAIALCAGAFYLWRRGGHGKQVTLMLVLALVMLANVLIWTIPDGDGAAPLERAATH